VTCLFKQLEWKDTLHSVIQTHSSVFLFMFYALCVSNVCDLSLPGLKFSLSSICRFSSYLTENTRHYKRELGKAVLVFWESNGIYKQALTKYTRKASRSVQCNGRVLRFHLPTAAPDRLTNLHDLIISQLAKYYAAFYAIRKFIYLCIEPTASVV
jgi:hypothetical protein